MAGQQEEIRRLATLLQQGQLTRESFQSQVAALKQAARDAAKQARAAAGPAVETARSSTVWRLPIGSSSSADARPIGAPIVESGPDLRPRGRVVSLVLVIICLALLAWGLVSAARGDASLLRTPELQLPEMRAPQITVRRPRQPDRPAARDDQPPFTAEEPPKPGEDGADGKDEQKT